jgi:uncharacterized protein (TIGR02996 family)
MSDEAAFLAAIIAQPGEDTPRLAYADWLDENDAPLQADFIRTQCRLASCSAADPDYPDLLERHAELAAQFGPIMKLTPPKLPPGFTFNTHITTPDADNFRRGFPHTVSGEWEASQMNPEDGEVEQFCAGLPELIATTTARQLSLTGTSGEQLTRILTTPGAEALTGLMVAPAVWTEEDDTLVRIVAGAKAAPDLERLSLYLRTSAASLVPLASAKLDRLVHLDLPMLSGRVRDLRAVIETQWFRGLRSVRTGASERPLESALLAALAQLPRLETLDLRFQNSDSYKALGSVRGFRSLTRLALWPGPGKADLGSLAHGTFARLAELDLSNARSQQLTTLLKARWFPRLRVLALRNGTLSDKSVVALSKSPAAAHLRILRLDDISIGKVAFAALGDGARFPNLTTLELNIRIGRKMRGAKPVAFATGLSLPRLRHLDLSGWPLGDTGAKALAKNPSLADLTRLALSRCGLGESGFAALVRSPHLQQLIELDVTNNKLKTAAALRDPARLPRLAAVRLAGNPFPADAYRALTAARGLVV